MKFVSYLLVTLFVIALLYSYAFWLIPLGILLVYLLMSCLTYLAYARDKKAAREGNWRTSESTLHLMSLLCGWPGAAIAQQSLRHKTRKTSFRSMFWVTVFINAAIFGWLHTTRGSAQLAAGVSTSEQLLNEVVSSRTVRYYLLYLTAYRSGHS